MEKQPNLIFELLKKINYYDIQKVYNFKAI